MGHPVAMPFTTGPGQASYTSAFPIPADGMGCPDMNQVWGPYRSAWGGPYDGALPDPLVTTVTLTAADPAGQSASITGTFTTNWESHPKWKRVVDGGDNAPGFTTSPAIMAAANVCARTAKVQSALALLTGKACGAITADGLARVSSLVILDGLPSLKAGDLDGLTNVTDLTLSGEYTTIPENIFADMVNLDKVNLRCDLTALPAGLFQNSPKIRSLDIVATDINTPLPATLFSSLTNLRSVGLTGNRLATLPDSLFANLPNLRYVGLGRNGITTVQDGMFRDSTNLRGVYLDNNKVATIGVDVFDSLPELILRRGQAGVAGPRGQVSGRLRVPVQVPNDQRAAERDRPERCPKRLDRAPGRPALG